MAVAAAEVFVVAGHHCCYMQSVCSVMSVCILCGNSYTLSVDCYKRNTGLVWVCCVRLSFLLVAKGNLYGAVFIFADANKNVRWLKGN